MWRITVWGSLGAILATGSGYAKAMSEAEGCLSDSSCRSCKGWELLRLAPQDPDEQTCQKTALSGLAKARNLFSPSILKSNNTPPSARLTTPPPRLQYPGQGYLVRPRTGGQLYVQRLVALRAGQLYSLIAPNTYVNQWQAASQQPTYQQWQHLLAREASMMATRQGNRSLTVLVGDSLYLWLPPEHLAPDRLWLNQSISGETTGHILRRLGYFTEVRPEVIYVMVGVNDLKNGADPQVVVSNIELIAQRLRAQHPRSRIVVLSILPTRLPPVSSSTVQWVNQRVARAIRQRGVEFVDLQPAFMDSQGLLRVELTTDGIHLSPQGYRLLIGHLNDP